MEPGSVTEALRDARKVSEAQIEELPLVKTHSESEEDEGGDGVVRSAERSNDGAECKVEYFEAMSGPKSVSTMAARLLDGRSSTSPAKSGRNPEYLETVPDGVPLISADSSSDESDNEMGALGESMQSIRSMRFGQQVSVKKFVRYLLKYAGRFKGWKRRWVTIDGCKLCVMAQSILGERGSPSCLIRCRLRCTAGGIHCRYYSRGRDSDLQKEVDLTNANTAEESVRNADNGFEVHTQAEIKLVLRAGTRKEMEEWMTVIRKAASRGQEHSLDNQHSWYLRASKSKLCNVCGKPCKNEKRSLICEVCGVCGHKSCIIASCAELGECKWTMLPSLPKEHRIPESPPQHQWVKGNLRAGSKCAVCHKSCSSSKKLEDLRCLWCQQTVHSMCRLMLPSQCSLGRHKVSILRPSCLILTKNRTTESEGRRGSIAVTRNLMERVQLLSSELQFRPDLVTWDVVSCKNAQPLIFFVNPKSGGNQGVQIMRALKSLLNPAQIIDLSKAGPSPGLDLMKGQSTFRAVGCGGDGTIGWILQEVDRRGIKNCQLAVLPLGTGNDLSRVLGWGPSASDDFASISNYIDAVEKSKSCFFDRWGVSVSTAAEHVLPVLDPKRHTINLDNMQENMRQRAFLDEATVEGIEKEYAIVKRVARFMGVFFHSVNSLFAGNEDSKGIPSDVSADDLKGMIAEFVQHARNMSELCSKITDDVKRKKDANHVSNLCDSIEVETNLFVNVLFAEDTGDADAEAALHSLQSKVDECACACATVVQQSAAGVPNRGSDSTRGVSLKIAPARMGKSHGGEGGNAGVFTKRVSRRLLGHGRRASQPAVSTDDPTKMPIYGEEKTACNNYFGIGLDAKVAMDFDTFRNKNPEKCRSRMKNQMWYGVIGAKETIHQTCKNLHQRLVLKCDGVEIKLPRLQGIVILNIGSYMGGTNFWGTKVEKRFRPPAYDDGIVEVVAVRSTTQMAAIKSLPGLFAPTRLAQARHVQISIRQGDPVPVQVDGEAFMQEPCTMTIYNKGRVQMLCRDRALQRLLNTWSVIDDDDTVTSLADLSISKLEEARKELVTACRIVGVERRGIAAMLESACSAAEVNSARLLKYGKGKMRKRVTDYMASIGTLIEVVKEHIDFVGEGNPVGDKVSCSSLSDGGVGLRRTLVAVEIEFSLALQQTNGDSGSADATDSLEDALPTENVDVLRPSARLSTVGEDEDREGESNFTSSGLDAARKSVTLDALDTDDV